MLRNSNRSSQRWTHKYTHIPYATILASSLVINGTKWRQGWSVGGLAEVCLCVYICACLLATSTLHSQSAVSRQNIIKLQMQQVHCKTCCWNEVEKTLFIVMINFKLKQIESFSFKIKMSISAYFLWTCHLFSKCHKRIPTGSITECHLVIELLRASLPGFATNSSKIPNDIWQR